MSRYLVLGLLTLALAACGGPNWPAEAQTIGKIEYRLHGEHAGYWLHSTKPDEFTTCYWWGVGTTGYSAGGNLSCMRQS